MVKMFFFRWAEAITVFVDSYFPLSEDGAEAVESSGALPHLDNYFRIFQCLTSGDGHNSQNWVSRSGPAPAWVEAAHLSLHLKRHLFPMTFRAPRWHLAVEC